MRIVNRYWNVISWWSFSQSQHILQYCYLTVKHVLHRYHQTPPPFILFLALTPPFIPITHHSARARTSNPLVRTPPTIPIGSKNRPPRSAPGPLDSRTTFPLEEEMFRSSSNFNLQFLSECQNIPVQHLFRMHLIVPEAECSGKVEKSWYGHNCRVIGQRMRRLNE